MKFKICLRLFQYIKRLITEKKEIICYLLFGLMTTIINFFSLWLFNIFLGMNEIIANTLAWTIAVTFAFITNKYFVFGSKSTNLSSILKEGFTFYSGRFLTLLIDNLFIFLFVTLMHFNLFFIKIITEFIIIVLNYILGKFIFSKKSNNETI